MFRIGLKSAYNYNGWCNGLAFVKHIFLQRIVGLAQFQIFEDKNLNLVDMAKNRNQLSLSGQLRLINHSFNAYLFDYLSSHTID